MTLNVKPLAWIFSEKSWVALLIRSRTLNGFDDALKKEKIESFGSELIQLMTMDSERSIINNYIPDLPEQGPEENDIDLF